MFATALNPDLLWREVKSQETKRGQLAKGRKGGRPPKVSCEPGELRERRERYQPLAKGMLCRGLTVPEIASQLNLQRRRFPARFIQDDVELGPEAEMS